MLAPLQFSPGGSGTAAVLLVLVFVVFAGLIYGGYVLLRRSSGDGSGGGDRVEELETRVEELEGERDEGR